ncbi:hypothetical protein BIS44_4132 [Mycobacterium tuberculosis variant bovis BCG]|uniref:Uncharacterized protein n=1 Tax=Mycobacterium tuberculosis (strain CDC 1551 / Oshkosh) TaxID=83331 RepID=Q8VIV8_MYCTO|nr:hypothetical protein MT3767.3 [Mycobacterium tuberculosis CDC1551]KAF3410809.1 hypothetical protein BIS44_4132 [Mycobacterium tuberculosis variant bovis BCG]
MMCSLQDTGFLGYDCILVSDCTVTTLPSSTSAMPAVSSRG